MFKILITITGLVLCALSAHTQDTISLTVKLWGYHQFFLPVGEEFSSDFDLFMGWHERALFVVEGGEPKGAVFLSRYSKGIYFNENGPPFALREIGDFVPYGKEVENSAVIPDSLLREVRTSRYVRKRNLCQDVVTFRLQMKLKARSLGEFEVKVLNPTAKSLKRLWKVEKLEVFQILEVYEAKFISDP